MQDFQIIMGKIIAFMQEPFTVWGYTFSFWNVYMLDLLLILVIWFIWQMFYD